MSFSEIERKKIDHLVGGLCRKHSSALLKNELRMEYAVEGFDVTIFECRLRSDQPDVWLQTPIARIQFAQSTSEWTLYQYKSSGTWLTYDPLSPNRDLLVMVNQIDLDPHHIFFG